MSQGISEGGLQQLINDTENDYALASTWAEDIHKLIAEVRRLGGELRVANTGILQLNTDKERLLRVVRAAKDLKHNVDHHYKCDVWAGRDCNCGSDKLYAELEAVQDLLGEG